jgi:hypothetical protein
MYGYSSRIGIAGFILSIIGFLMGIILIGVVFDILAIIFCIVGFAKKTGKNGFNIAGLTIGIVALVVTVVFIFPTIVGWNVRNGDKKADLTIGDIGVLEDIEISVTSMEEYVSENQYIKPEKGNMYIKVALTAKNNSKNDVKTISGYWDFDSYADDETAEQAASSVFDDDKFFDGTISPGKKLTGYLIFEVPKDTEKFEIQYRPSWYDNDYISFAGKLK